MIDIEIDGQQLKVEPGTMIIEVADNAGIHIPRFCYHRKLSIAANCRMCLVEVANSKKPVAACATPVTDGMQVFTKSEAARHSQKTVMEFLLINHPLDCPICDQGGQCELQDVAMGFGSDVSQFTEGKRAVFDKDIGSLVSTDMTRCIHCTRCVRFGEEVAGLPEMGAPGRGEHTEIGTYVEKSLTSELAGNIIDLCPVGALTSKPFRFRARAWEMQEHITISPHDCVGSHLRIHRLRDEVMRVVPGEDETLNEIWLSDRDRFSYLSLKHADRITHPQIKENGTWKTVDWMTALNKVVEGFSRVVNQSGADQVGVLASASATIEEHYLLQKVFRRMGVANIDHRIRQSDFSDQDNYPLHWQSDVSIKDIQNQEVILLIGANVCREQPIIGNRVRKATRRGHRVMALNPMQYEWHFPISEEKIVSLNNIPFELGCIAKAVLQETNAKLDSQTQSILAKCTPSDIDIAIAKQLMSASNGLLMLGEIALLHPNGSAIRAVAELIKTHAKVGVMYLTQGANTQGAWLAGCLPHRLPASGKAAQIGLSAKAMFEQPRNAYCFLNLDPELDCANPAQVTKAVKQAEFVVSLSPYRTGLLEQEADVLLPVTPFTENEGTYVNLEGRWQSFTKAVLPVQQSRPAWKVLRVLGNLCDVEHCQYETVQEIKAELQNLVEQATLSVNFSIQNNKPLEKGNQENTLQRLGAWPLYGCDNLVRRSGALQLAGSSDGEAKLHISPNAAAKHGLINHEKALIQQNGNPITLPVVIDAALPDDTVKLLSGYQATSRLGEPFGRVTIMRSEQN